MIQIITRLNQTIEENLEALNKLTEAEFSFKPAPEKWSKKEVIGHLIDSAHNNLRRFIVGQYAPDTKIIYDQNFWNTINDYQHMPSEDLLRLWVLMNKRIAVVLGNMPKEKYHNTIDTGRDNFSPKNLMWLADDYVKHMQHHINQIFPGTYDVLYT